MKRRNREISIFNMSMLDVICSALGAILILFIVTLQSENQAQAKAEDFEKKYQNLEQKVQTQQDQLKAKEQALAQTLQQLQQQAQQVKSQQQMIRQIAAANAKLQQQKQGAGQGTGMAIGMCEVKQVQVQISVFDHGSEDFDRISVKLNKTFIARDMTIRKQPAGKNIALQPGVNYINIKALDEGQSPPNTATIVINPCNNGKPESFIWDMKTGDARNISVVRK